MPELPEVETVLQNLKAKILGEEISDVEIYYPRLIQNTTVEDFKNHLIHQKVSSFHRFGKYLIISFTNSSLIIHMRMEGKFFIKPISDEKGKYELLKFDFASGKSLRYEDFRKFGKFALILSTDVSEVLKYPSLAKLGKDASEKWEKDELYKKIKNKKIAIKKALMDQTIIAGLGNIYTDEVLFLSRISPKQRTDTISREQANEITKHAKEVMEEAIKYAGTTIRSFSNLGHPGQYQHYLFVHGRENKECLGCHGTIEKTVVGGRGTYFCPSCQRLRPYLIGITGGIASGKSLISRTLREWNYLVLDSDEIVRELHQDAKVIKKIAKLDPNIVKDDKINRKALANKLYQDAIFKTKIEEILHPLVKNKMEKKIEESNEKVLFLDIPLLYEANMESLCDAIIVVNLDYETNVLRLMERDKIDRDYASLKIANQMPLPEKVKRATYVIDNNGSREDTINQLKEILKKIRI